ncbi:hypothetical protein D9M68_979590 [compost metagenome]
MHSHAGAWERCHQAATTFASACVRGNASAAAKVSTPNTARIRYNPASPCRGSM